MSDKTERIEYGDRSAISDKCFIDTCDTSCADRVGDDPSSRRQVIPEHGVKIMLAFTRAAVIDQIRLGEQVEDFFFSEFIDDENVRIVFLCIAVDIKTTVFKTLDGEYLGVWPM